MKVFLDTEFIAGFDKPLFKKKRQFIDLISIGLVDEYGRTYYAISSDFDPNDAAEWVQKHVLEPIVSEWVRSHHGDARNEAISATSGQSVIRNIRLVQRKIGKTEQQIADEVRRFVYAQAVSEGDGMGGLSADIEYWLDHNKVEFYGYYGDYDWVVFCALFGKMHELPKGFPMFLHDIKQMMEERGLDQEWKRRVCPDPEGEHNALIDAEWNMRLYAEVTQHEIKSVVG